MGMIEHQAAAAQIEATFQQALGPTTVQNQTSAGPPALPLPPLPQAAVNAALIAKYRALRASAIQNGVSPVPYISALKELGTGGS
jgi:hypothetical protein